MLLAFIALLIHYGMLYASHNVNFLYASQIPHLFAHGMMCGQALVTITSTPENRAKLLGMLAIPFALGILYIHMKHILSYSYNRYLYIYIYN